MLGRTLDPVTQFREWQYRRFTAGVQQRNFAKLELSRDGYVSQCGQDKFLVEEVFLGKRGGTFVDVGAHDGQSFSNTYYLERYFDWGGIVVEPMPEAFEELSRNRTCIKINGCIARKAGQARFRKIEGYAQMLSGLVARYDARHLRRIERELRVYGGSTIDIDVECYRFGDLLLDHEVRKIDYVSLDVEGAEYEILRSIDFDLFDIKVLSVENNYRDYRIPKFMKANGFEFVAIVGDEFYVKAGLQCAGELPPLDSPTSHREMP